MTDSEIKQKLKDASLYLSDAAKRWPRHKDVARNNVNGAMAALDEIWDYVNRTMGAVEFDEDTMTATVLGSMVNGF